MGDELKCYCRHCGTELPPSHTGQCPKCGKLGKDCKVTAHAVVGIQSTIKARQKRKGFRKFIREILQGWFPSGDPKYPKGVEKVRIIDKEKDEYRETTKDVATGEVTHDVHEPLTKHISQAKPKEEETKQEATNGH